MDPTNLNTCPNMLSVSGSSNACAKDELCFANMFTLAFKEYPDENRSMPVLTDSCIKEEVSCTTCVINALESCHVQSERPLSDIKLEHLHNDDDLPEIARSKVSGIDEIYTNKVGNLEVSTSFLSHLKLEPANRRDDNFNESVGESVHTDIDEKIVYENKEEIELKRSKKQHKVYDNEYNRRKHGVIELSDVNIFMSEDIGIVKVDSLSSHCDIPHINEEATECYALEAQNSTKIVCCPDILGEIAQSHTKRKRKKIMQTHYGRNPGKNEQIDENKHSSDELNRCKIPLPIVSSKESRIDPVEEFILPDILPVKPQAMLGEMLTPSDTQCVDFSPKNIKKGFPEAIDFKEDGTPTDFRPKMKKFIMEDFNMITGQHKANNFTIECLECNMIFKKRFHLKEHNKLKHSKRKFTFACSWEGCKFACYLEKGLKTHLISHTNEKPYICSLCDLGFRTRGKLNNHILTHSDTKPFKCQECNYNCSSKGDLKRHSVIHTGTKKFACTICEYAGYRKDNLKAHMLTHSGEKPFPCTLCNVKCSRNGDLIRHMLTHSGERPFGCSQCNYKCLKKSDLSRHALTHTGERRHSCTICTHVSATKSNLKLHMAVHKS